MYSNRAVDRDRRRKLPPLLFARLTRDLEFTIARHFRPAKSNFSMKEREEERRMKFPLSAGQSNGHIRGNDLDCD